VGGRSRNQPGTRKPCVRCANTKDHGQRKNYGCSEAAKKIETADNALRGHGQGYENEQTGGFFRGQKDKKSKKKRGWGGWGGEKHRARRLKAQKDK